MNSKEVNKSRKLHIIYVKWILLYANGIINTSIALYSFKFELSRIQTLTLPTLGVTKCDILELCK